MAAGDEQALGLLYDRWEHTVRAMAVRVLADGMEAEDVVEDVFWQAWRQAGRFDAARGSAATWLLTIARSRALDHARTIRRRREDGGLDELAPSADDALLADAIDPLEAAALGERSVKLRAALAELPAEQRDVLVLGYFDGLSQSEIAERTGEPLGTVKTRMRLALRKLRDRLDALRGGVS
jgi:RNA polymerase sigma-70 factor (ECF subfamily)